MMYQVNDVVLYGVDGVCRITEIVNRPIRGGSMEFYVLKSCAHEKVTIYVPTSNEDLVGRMQHVLSADEIQQMMKVMPEEETVWIEDERDRKERYNEILSGDDRLEIYRVIKTLSHRQRELSGKNKKLHAADERLLRDAERRLYDEFAHVLKIEPEQVRSMLG